LGNIIETKFNSRWALVEGYHQVGERIRVDDNLKKLAPNGYSKQLTNLLQDLAVNINCAESTIWRSTYGS
jgi:hypothetical protein